MSRQVNHFLLTGRPQKTLRFRLNRNFITRDLTKLRGVYVKCLNHPNDEKASPV